MQMLSPQAWKIIFSVKKKHVYFVKSYEKTLGVMHDIKDEDIKEYIKIKQYN